ncbi:MAG TPA: hypothetical protein VNR11_16645 [Xanthobacteraceae bacterium]|nr:hypothetical protein [Xanthobacteraceae bacterium]
MHGGHDKFQSQVRAWLDDDYGRLQRWQRAAAGVFYNRFPRSFRALPIFHWFGRNALAASAPIVALFYGTIGQVTAFWAAGGLFFANVAVWVLGVLSEKKKGNGEAEAEALVRFGDLLSAFKVGAVAKANRDRAIGACLGILEIHARRITKTKKGELSVSLVQYVGSSTTKMTIKYRNPGNLRSVGREFDCSALLGHHACQAGALPRVVHNLSQFGKNLTSPTQSTIDYKSMLFIPLEVATSGGGARLKGFVSFDCQRPYAFYGNRNREIAVTCRPVIDHLKDLLRENG